MSNSNSSSSGGIGFVGLLQIAFIVLKLCKVIEWSWFWVLSPAWIILSIWAIAIAVAVIFKLTKKEDIKEVPEKSKWGERYDKMMEEQKRLQRRKAEKMN